MNSPLEGLGARRQSSVDGHNGAARIGRTFGGKKRNSGANFFGASTAAERQRLEQIFPIVSAPGAIERLLFHKAYQPFSGHRPRINRHNADAILRADAAKRLGESGERGVSCNTADIFRVMGLSR